MPNAAAEPLRATAAGATDACHPDPASLCNLYMRWFDVVRADTPERLREAYRLRYQVYCVENAFEDATAHADGLETDEFDTHSVHSLLIHRPTGMVAGTVRLILPHPSQGVDRLPIARVCRHPLLHNPAAFPPERTAEISRFAVSKAFRRRLSDAQHVDLHFLETPLQLNPDERRVMIPNITLGLMKAIAQMSIENGVTHLCAVMEPALLRLTARLGIRFAPLGPVVEYHGTRQPCFSEISTLGNALLQTRPDALELISDKGRYWSQPTAMPAE